MDKLRSQFEVKFNSSPYEWEFSRYGDNDAWAGRYVEYPVECAWESYQAAHAEFMVSLVEVGEYWNHHGHFALAKNTDKLKHGTKLYAFKIKGTNDIPKTN